MKKTPDEKVLVVDVSAARVLGVYPLAHDEAEEAGSVADPGTPGAASDPAPAAGSPQAAR
jgi:hypothetical protein